MKQVILNAGICILSASIIGSFVANKIPKKRGHFLIISHQHKFIFIKTNKTAGTSIEIALSKFCGPNDVITPIDREDEAIRQQLGYPGPQNDKGFYNHISAEKIKAKIGDDVWEHYFKFCVERNPWDRYVSFYYFRHKTEPRPDINRFVDDDIVQRLKQYGFQNYTIDHKIAVDRVCLYENLEDEMKEIAQLLRLPHQLELPNAKGQFRQDRRHYSEVLDAHARAKIAEIFADEIRLFDYHF